MAKARGLSPSFCSPHLDGETAPKQSSLSLYYAAALTCGYKPYGRWDNEFWGHRETLERKPPLPAGLSIRPPANSSRRCSAITVNSPADPYHNLNILLNTVTIYPLVPTYKLSPPCRMHRVATQFIIQTRAALRVSLRLIHGDTVHRGLSQMSWRLWSPQFHLSEARKVPTHSL